jgi:hypothetical protein
VLLRLCCQRFSTIVIFTAAAAAAAAVGLQLGDFMAAVARKAAHDTQVLGNMIAQKAQHDMNALQEQKKPHPAPDAA